MDFCRKQVKADCEELLRRFQQTQSVRFEIFARIWRKMAFSQIFHGTVSHEKRKFSRLILDMASVFFLPPFSFQIRVGGLYLLYSLYQCQSASPSEQDWADVKMFEKDATEAQHFDVVYILKQLMFCKAFHFTAMPSLLAYNRKKNVERSPMDEKFMERVSRPQELINIELLDEMSNIHQHYDKLKASTLSLTSAQSDPSINLIRKNLVPQLRKTVIDFYKWQKKKDSPHKEDNSEGASSQQESSRRAELLASIKSKAYEQAAEASKSRRHRQVEVDFTSSEAGPAPMLGRPRTTKLSLKARTMENVHISDGLRTEATATTKISRLAQLESARDETPKQCKRFKWF
ncbi:snRNA-activating protein complex subunit 1b isoform X2 [Archocentrus centrarchus]|uniref:snRNA-activating protein complex subunit 1b isoform X2 n=1 Tax=Archocentrus centrarchus TaxID=63155 RepID=UPI0011EA09E4|nr:snRNA-activating protein complex subunit 1 isoform X2 [Archocentrus centrarchus]